MKIKSTKIILSLLLFVFVVSSCTIKKRKYQKGMYVNVKHHLHNNKISKNKKDDVLSIIELKVMAKEAAASKQELVASIAKAAPPIPKTRPTKINEAKNDSCGDLIIMLDGGVIEASVVEVNQTTVKYKKCNNVNGPTYTTALEKIERIQYKDGSQDIVDSGAKPGVRFVPKGADLKYKTIGESKSNNQQQINSNKNEKDVYNQTAIGSLVCGIISFFVPIAIITGPIALITGIIALRQLRTGIGIRGHGMATFGIVIGTIVLLILLLLILLL